MKRAGDEEENVRNDLPHSKKRTRMRDDEEKPVPLERASGAACTTREDDEQKDKNTKSGKETWRKRKTRRDLSSSSLQGKKRHQKNKNKVI